METGEREAVLKRLHEMKARLNRQLNDLDTIINSLAPSPPIKARAVLGPQTPLAVAARLVRLLRQPKHEAQEIRILLADEEAGGG